MDKYVVVPVVDVHKDNLDEVWPAMLQAVRGASFVAIDTELSGLGERKKLVAKSVEDRYRNLIDVAKSRAILTLGISCFREQLGNADCRTVVPTQNEGLTVEGRRKDDDVPSRYLPAHYKVQTFNLSVLSCQEFVVEPGSLQFLIQHGFDFNKQFSKGISYNKGTDKEPYDFTKCSVRNLFAHILLANKPVVLHNGLLDLVFLYQHFYADLPEKLDIFTTDVYEMFPAGVLDTKFVSEFKLREPASYLGYIFRKCQRHNTSCQESAQKYVAVEFCDVAAHRPWVEHLCCHGQPKESNEYNIQVCEIYAAHGFCHRGLECHLSHDIDHILDKSEKHSSKKKKKKRKRKVSTGETQSTPEEKRTFIEQQTNTGCTDQTNTNPVSTESNVDHQSPSIEHCQEIAVENGSSMVTGNTGNNNSSTGGHRAGIDAFMTGYCLATYLVQCRIKSLRDNEWCNKISLSGKDVPLTFAPSHFSKPSIAHTQKIRVLKEALLTL